MLRVGRGRIPLPPFLVACLLSAITLVAWAGMLYGDLGSREAVFVQRDGVAVDISHLPTAQAVPIKVHTLKQGQELPPGAVVINPAQQDASADGTAGQRERVQRAEVGSRAVMTSKREASIRGKVRSASVQSGGAGGTAQVLKSKSKQQKLMFARTTASAAWPSERNPLRDFDADFLDTYNVKGFPATTGTANWPFTKNPLLGFDEGFRNKWKGWQGPEHNVYAQFPSHYPFVETKLPPSMAHYKTWTNAGGKKETNVYDDPDIWPNY